MAGEFDSGYTSKGTTGSTLVWKNGKLVNADSAAMSKWRLAGKNNTLFDLDSQSRSSNLIAPNLGSADITGYKSVVSTGTTPNIGGVEVGGISATTMATADATAANNLAKFKFENSGDTGLGSYIDQQNTKAYNARMADVKGVNAKWDSTLGVTTDANAINNMDAMNKSYSDLAKLDKEAWAKNSDVYDAQLDRLNKTAMEGAGTDGGVFGGADVGVSPEIDATKGLDATDSTTGGMGNGELALGIGQLGMQWAQFNEQKHMNDQIINNANKNYDLANTQLQDLKGFRKNTSGAFA